MFRAKTQGKKVTVAYHLPADVVKRVEELADERGTNKSHEAEKALRKGLPDRPQKPTGDDEEAA
jgi:predicted transcriptional regulator